MSNTFIETIAEDIRALVSPEDLPSENSRLLFRIYAVLAVAKGEEVSRADVHAAWVAWMIGVDREHAALLPFHELSHEAQMMDEPYAAAIREVARAHDL